MLTDDIQNELLHSVATELRKNDNFLSTLPYQSAVDYAAQLAVYVFAAYEAKKSLGKAKTITIDGLEFDLFQAEVDELHEMITPDIDKYIDDGTVVWFNTAKEALANKGGSCSYGDAKP